MTKVVTMGYMKLREQLTLDALRTASERVLRLRQELDEALQERDELIRLAAPWARTVSLRKATKLTRQQLWRIAPIRDTEEED